MTTRSRSLTFQVMLHGEEFIHYRPEFKTQIAVLQTHLWSPSTELNTAYFEWKYERNPFVRDPLVNLMMHRGIVVGMRGFHGIELEAGLPAKRFTELYADDIVIAPGYRKRGHTGIPPTLRTLR